MATVRQILYILTLALVGYTGATGGLDADTAAGIIAQVLSVLTAGTALVNTPLPGTDTVRPTLTGQTIAGATVDALGRIMPGTRTAGSGRHSAEP